MYQPEQILIDITDRVSAIADFYDFSEDELPFLVRYAEFEALGSAFVQVLFKRGTSLDELFALEPKLKSIGWHLAPNMPFSYFKPVLGWVDMCGEGPSLDEAVDVAYDLVNSLRWDDFEI